MLSNLVEVVQLGKEPVVRLRVIIHLCSKLLAKGFLTVALTMTFFPPTFTFPSSDFLIYFLYFSNIRSSVYNCITFWNWMEYKYLKSRPSIPTFVEHLY